MKKDTPEFITRAYDLGLKVASNFHTTLSVEQIEFYENNLKLISQAITRGFIIESAVPTVEPSLDFIIKVDRSKKPVYPDWVEKVIHPKFETSGPAKYDLSQVEQWLHDDQKSGSVVGNTIYKHLQKGDALATCLNLQDGLAIQAKGITVFRKLFTGKMVFLWGSVVQDRDGRLDVPCLYEDGDEVVVDWRWLGSSWDSCYPALRFGK